MSVVKISSVEMEEDLDEVQKCSVDESVDKGIVLPWPADRDRCHHVSADGMDSRRSGNTR
jgi:hypothetical protein